MKSLHSALRQLGDDVLSLVGEGLYDLELMVSGAMKGTLSKERL